MIIYGIYNADTLEKLSLCIKCITLQLGMKGYLPVNLTIGIIGIYPRNELAITS